MADSTINELDLIDSVTDSDSIPVYDVSDTSTTPTKKGTFAKILDWISSKTLSSLNTSSALPINSTAVTTVTDKKQNAFSELASKTDFASSDLVIVRSGSTDYKGTLGDLLKTAVSQINATTVNATEFKQNSNDVLDTSNVISVLDTSSSNPINSNAVNNALTHLNNHNIPRLTPKDISSYIADGSLWQRLNGTDGFSLFEDIYVGDYIQMSRPITVDGSYDGTVGSQYVMIAGINTLQGNGDTTNMMYNHLVMVPGGGQKYEHAQHFGRRRMNATHTTVGGYVGSEMYTTHLGAVATSGNVNGNINQQLYAEFGTHLKTTRELLSNSINASGYNRLGSNSGCSNSWDWYSCQAVLMSEVECYGSIIWSSSGFDTGNANQQLPLFRHSTKAQNDRSAYYWLKDVDSSVHFCFSGNLGHSSGDDASDGEVFVRPRFVIA